MFEPTRHRPRWPYSIGSPAGRSLGPADQTHRSARSKSNTAASVAWFLAGRATSVVLGVMDAVTLPDAVFAPLVVAVGVLLAGAALLTTIAGTLVDWVLVVAGLAVSCTPRAIAGSSQPLLSRQMPRGWLPN